MSCSITRQNLSPAKRKCHQVTFPNSRWCRRDLFSCTIRLEKFCLLHFVKLSETTALFINYQMIFFALFLTKRSYNNTVCFKNYRPNTLTDCLTVYFTNYGEIGERYVKLLKVNQPMRKISFYIVQFYYICEATAQNRHISRNNMFVHVQPTRNAPSSAAHLAACTRRSSSQRTLSHQIPPCNFMRAQSNIW